MCNLLTSLCDFVLCDRVVQRAYWGAENIINHHCADITRGRNWRRNYAIRKFQNRQSVPVSNSASMLLEPCHQHEIVQSESQRYSDILMRKKYIYILQHADLGSWKWEIRFSQNSFLNIFLERFSPVLPTGERLRRSICRILGEKIPEEGCPRYPFL